jgi:hypothetical protein
MLIDCSILILYLLREGYNRYGGNILVGCIILED